MNKPKCERDFEKEFLLMKLIRSTGSRKLNSLLETHELHVLTVNGWLWAELYGEAESTLLEECSDEIQSIGQAFDELFGCNTFSHRSRQEREQSIDND